MAGIDERLRRQNPWWMEDVDGALAEDPHLRRFRSAGARWDPPLLRALSLDPGHTHTLRGPRQSGKTTLMKRLLARLLKGGEGRVLYFSFDLETEPAAIYETVARARALHPDPEGPWYLFLDEVTAIEGWQAGVKHAWDVGLTSDDFILATGSSAHDLRRGGEQLPGRRGAGRDLVQLPMSFREFCMVTGTADVPEESVSPQEILSEEGGRILRSAYLGFDALDRAFRAYRRTGGFPAAVSNWVETRDVSGETVQTLWRTVAGDVAGAGLDQTAAVKLLERVSVSLGSRMAWTEAAEAMDVADPKTAKRYAQFLAEGFALLIVHFWDRSGKTLRPAKMRKVYFVDPLFARVPGLAVPGAREPAPDAIVENVVAVALFRSAASALVQSAPAPGSVGYWRASGSGREIDFVIPHPESASERLPLEVKGDGSTAIANARKAIRQSFGSGLITTRTVWEPDERVPAVPAPVLLACLEERSVRG